MVTIFLKKSYKSLFKNDNNLKNNEEKMMVIELFIVLTLQKKMALVFF